MRNTMPEEYFFVSDLHIGGDEQLKILDHEDEFIAFLTGCGSSRPQRGCRAGKVQLAQGHTIRNAP